VVTEHLKGNALFRHRYHSLFIPETNLRVYSIAVPGVHLDFQQETAFKFGMSVLWAILHDSVQRTLDISFSGGWGMNFRYLLTDGSFPVYPVIILVSLFIQMPVDHIM